jgi:hypothetical protein
MPATVARRLAKAEAVGQERQQRRVGAACDDVRRDLLPAQRALVDAWWDGRRENVAGIAPCPGSHRTIGFCERCIGEADPPALLRAMWVLVMAHMRDDTPASLTPDTAQVYVDDPDAWPLSRCERCRYLLPMRAALLADGTFRVVGQYDGECPACGLDTRQAKEIEG